MVIQFIKYTFYINLFNNQIKNSPNNNNIINNNKFYG